jgi:uncharacterized protein (TIGR03437 family)
VVGDSNGDIYIGTSNTIWRLNTEGQLQRAGGNGGTQDSVGDGGSALLAPMAGTTALTWDRDRNLLTAGFTVRRIHRESGIVQTVAGSLGPVITDEPVSAISVRFAPSPPYLDIARDDTTLYITTEDRIFQVTPVVVPSLPAVPEYFDIQDAASFISGMVGPGRIVSLMGNYLSPPGSAALTLGTDGRVTTELNGTRVLFGGVAAPLLYVSPGQINAVVPYSYVPTTDVRVQSPGGQSPAVKGIVRSTAPTIFPGAILNADGSINSAEHPSPKGGTIVAFGTGMGPLFPAVADGSVIRGPDLPRPITGVTARIVSTNDSVVAPVAYAGPAPNFVAGVMQVNVAIPLGRPGGRSSLQLANRDVGPSHPIYIETSTPTILSINPVSPKGGFSGQTIDVTGTGFDSDMSLELFYGGVLDQRLGQVRLQSDTGVHLTNFSFGVKTGRWGIEAVNPNGLRSARFSFDVVP